MSTFKLLALLLLVPAFVLAGCGSGDDNSSSNDSNKASTGNEAAGNTPDETDQPAPPKEASYPYNVNADLARVYLKHNIIDEALRLFDLAIMQQRNQTNTDDATVWAGFGDALVRANRKKEAAVAYSRSLEIYKQVLPKAQTNQNHNQIIGEIAKLCAVLGLEDDRMTYLSQLKADEKNPSQQIELAGVLEQVGQKEKAETHYKLALELTKDDPKQLALARVAYAGMLFRAERLDEALETAKAAYDTEGLNSETKTAARRMLFSIYEARGEADKMEFK